MKVAVIGAGVMGSGIASAIVLGGHEAVVYDIVPEALRNSEKLIGSLIKEMNVKNGELGGFHVESSLNEAVKEADIVFEVIIEDLNAKRDLYKKLTTYLEQDVPVASNTSTFTVEQLSKNLKIRDRILIAHWVNPPYVIPLVEVARGPWTSERAVSKVVAFLEEIGKEPVMVPDIPGLIVNRFNSVVYREALRLVANYNIDPKIIDLVWKRHLAVIFSVTGVLGTMDYVGLDTIVRAASSLSSPSQDEDMKAASLIVDKVSRGELGVKSGLGFYPYSGSDRLSLELRRAQSIRGVLKCLEDMS
ncbi:MAG: 3-hydroxyacyl-CoA dehydrogenase family protein [Desulfurococcales archaeon]|nr:3-hydroxyacyl-CoA dehydrogenase family protein [Desulfurococcales archaeon]